MLNVTLQHLELFPTWLRAMLVYTSGLWLLVFIGTSILRMLQEPHVRACLHHAPAVIMRIDAKMRELLQDPYEYRTIAKVLEYGTVAAYIALSTILFIDFLILLLLLVTTPRQLSWVQQISVLCFSLVCAVAGAVLKAEAGRCRSRLRGRASS
jgi:hypothetical protein